MRHCPDVAKLLELPIGAFLLFKFDFRSSVGALLPHHKAFEVNIGGPMDGGKGGSWDLFEESVRDHGKPLMKYLNLTV